MARELNDTLECFVVNTYGEIVNSLFGDIIPFAVMYSDASLSVVREKHSLHTKNGQILLI